MKKARINVLLGAFIALLAAFPLQGMAQKLSVSYQNVPIEEVLEDLKKKTNYDFVYQKKVLENVPRLSGHYSNMTINQILDKLLLGTGLDYDRVRSTIVIRKADGTARSSKRKITGKVVCEYGEALLGAHVRIKNTSIGTITDADGSFSLVIDGSQTALLFSYIGMDDKEFRITEKMPTIEFDEVEHLYEVSRGGFGSTGKA